MPSRITVPCQECAVDLAAESPSCAPDRLHARVVWQRGEELEHLPFRAEPRAARMLARRPAELSPRQSGTSGRRVRCAGLAEAGAETVELGTDG
jgi:hypothetical protein